MLLDIRFDRVADADDPVAPGHDRAVSAYAVEAVHGGNPWNMQSLIGKPGQPCRNPAVHMQKVGGEVREDGLKFSNARKKGQRIF